MSYITNALIEDLFFTQLNKVNGNQFWHTSTISTLRTFLTHAFLLHLRFYIHRLSNSGLSRQQTLENVKKLDVLTKYLKIPCQQGFGIANDLDLADADGVGGKKLHSRHSRRGR